MEPRSLEPSRLLVMMMNIMMTYHSFLAATDALKTATICVLFFCKSLSMTDTSYRWTKLLLYFKHPNNIHDLNDYTDYKSDLKLPVKKQFI